MRPPREPPHGPLATARLVERENRYRARVELDGGEVAAHVPNPGRMAELMLPGVRLHIVAVAGGHRVTGYDVVAVEHAGRWVCIDNRLGGRLARRALEGRAMPELLPYETVAREVRCGDSRLDFRLHGGGRVCWVELKSCTLVIDGCGRFPDAPTARGRRHLMELIRRREAGDEAAVLFLVQRPEAEAIGPHQATDPAFAAALGEALAAGVRAIAYTSSWSAAGLSLGRSIPVRQD